MTGPSLRPTEKIHTFYQYDPHATFLLNIPAQPKVITVTESKIHLKNTALFERPVLYLSLEDQSQLPGNILADRTFMDYLKACSWLIPVKDLPTNISAPEKKAHICKPLESLGIFSRLANEGYPPAQYYLGMTLLVGHNLQQNIPLGIQYLLNSAELNFAASQTFLGYINEHGTFVTKNIEYALSFYALAAKQGSPLALYLLGNCYEYGKGVQENLRKASHLYTEAIKRNFFSANFSLYMVYFKIMNAQTTLTIDIEAAHTPNRLSSVQFHPIAPVPEPKFYFQKRSPPSPSSPSKRLAIEQTSL